MGRVVVGVDGSDHAAAAATWAAREARLRGATLEVVHVWQLPATAATVEVGVNMPELFEEGAQQLLDAALTRVRAEGRDLVVEGRLLAGPDRAAIVQAADGAELLVVGARGAGGVVGLLMGSVSDHALRHAPCPVVVVPTPPPWGKGVVVGVDGSSSSRAALRLALDEARWREVGVRAVMVWSAVAQLGDEGPTGQLRPDYGEADAARALDVIITEVAGDDRGRVEPVVVSDLPTPALLDAGRDAELLVVGARGLGGFRALLLGSVSTQVAHHSTTPVLVVRE